MAEKRNLGLSAAKGQYVIFLDADDNLDLQLLEILHSRALRYDADLVIPEVTTSLENKCLGFESGEQSPSLIYGGVESVIDLFFSRYLMDNPYKESRPFYLDAVWGRAYRKSIIDTYNLRFIEYPIRAEDALFNNLYILHSSKVVLLRGYTGYFWNFRAGSEMSNWASPFLTVAPFCDELHRHLEKVNRKYSENEMHYLKAVVSSNTAAFRNSYRQERNAKEKRLILKRAANSMPKNSLAWQAFLFEPIGKRMQIVRTLFRMNFPRIGLWLYFAST